jgi:hypothetical protein
MSPLGKVICEYGDFEGGGMDFSALLNMQLRDVAWFHLMDRMSRLPRRRSSTRAQPTN